MGYANEGFRVTLSGEGGGERVRRTVLLAGRLFDANDAVGSASIQFQLAFPTSPELAAQHFLKQTEAVSKS